jgi:hypothetical protein
VQLTRSELLWPVFVIGVVITHASNSNHHRRPIILWLVVAYFFYVTRYARQRSKILFFLAAQLGRGRGTRINETYLIFAARQASNCHNVCRLDYRLPYRGRGKAIILHNRSGSEKLLNQWERRKDPSIVPKAIRTTRLVDVFSFFNNSGKKRLVMYSYDIHLYTTINEVFPSTKSVPIHLISPTLFIPARFIRTRRRYSIHTSLLNGCTGQMVRSAVDSELAIRVGLRHFRSCPGPVPLMVQVQSR